MLSNTQVKNPEPYQTLTGFNLWDWDSDNESEHVRLPEDLGNNPMEKALAIQLRDLALRFSQVSSISDSTLQILVLL